MVALVFTLVLGALTTLMGSLDFSTSIDAYERALRDRHEEMAEARLYRNLWTTVLVPPQPLTVLARGAVEGAAMRYYIGLGRYTMSTSLVGSVVYDDLMLILVRADFTTVVALLLSFLAVALGFDAVCGERRQGSLKLLLSNSVSRGQVVAPKLLGGALALGIPLAVAFAVSLAHPPGQPRRGLQRPGRGAPGDDLRPVLSGAVRDLCAQCAGLDPGPQSRHLPHRLPLRRVGYANALPALARYGIDSPPFREYQEQAQRLFAEYGEALVACLFAVWAVNRADLTGYAMTET